MSFFGPSKEEAKWYVIRVVSGTEQSVHNSLMQRRESMGLQDYIVDCFVPTHDIVMANVKGVKSTRKKNIFPGYILVKILVTNESWYVVRNTPNVTGFLGSGTVPVPVTEAELEVIQKMIQERTKEYKTIVKVGDFATITSGTFLGSEGKVVEVNEKKGIVKMMINLLGRDTPVEIDFSEVKVKH